MKRLLLLPLLCLMPAAHAVDYVKCEAMQKAMYRLEARENQLLSRTNFYQFGLEIVKACQHLEGWGLTSKEYTECSDAARERIRNTPDFQANRRERDQISKRMEAVQADYYAEGCY